MDVPFLHLLFSLEQIRPLTSPYALFELKQLFPVAFRRANGCAVHGGPCRSGADCPCRAVFGQALSTDPAALRRYQKPPLPFAFKMPLLSVPAGAASEISLVIVGDGMRHLELYLESIRQLFAANAVPGVKLQAIAAVAPDGSRQRLGSGSGNFDLAATPLRSFAEACLAPVSNGGAVTLELTAPLRLLHNGKALRTPAFSALAGALLRRVSAMAYYYGGVELDHDFKWLAARSQEIRTSATQLELVNWGGSLQGSVGKLTFSGELEEFLPFLRLGELLNVGKGASYGMGSYKLGWLATSPSGDRI